MQTLCTSCFIKQGSQIVMRPSVQNERLVLCIVEIWVHHDSASLLSGFIEDVPSVAVP